MKQRKSFNDKWFAYWLSQMDDDIPEKIIEPLLRYLLGWSK